MKKLKNEIELIELEIQLSCPEGIFGIEVAKRMGTTNRNLIEKTVDSLNINKNSKVLEIGHGNGIHVPYVLGKNHSIKYSGLEISETMHSEAKRLNQTFSKETQIEFNCYDGENIPYDENNFDFIFTVNTIYFWQEPILFLKEIQRVLAHNGLFSIGIVDGEFMKGLPFVNSKFNLYSRLKVEKLLM